MLEAFIFLLLVIFFTAVVVTLLSWLLGLVPGMPTGLKNLLMAGVVLIALIIVLRRFYPLLAGL